MIEEWTHNRVALILGVTVGSVMRASVGCILFAALLFVLALLRPANGADSCGDFDDAAIKKLCRKVESQEKYLEKLVENQFKAETVRTNYLFHLKI